MWERSGKDFLEKTSSSLNPIISFANVMPLILGFLTVGSPEIFLASMGAAYKVKPVWREPSSALCFPSGIHFSFSKIITVMSSLD